MEPVLPGQWTTINHKTGRDKNVGIQSFHSSLAMYIIETKAFKTDHKSVKNMNTI